MIRFYAPEIERMSELAEADSGHCCRVLRLHEGDTVHVVDGMGHVFICAEAGNSNCSRAGTLGCDCSSYVVFDRSLSISV